ncbi:MAG: DUF3391 domain-containing protein [Gammaproteobacteria bacterium]|nr:DUF3391 domain-containing protein [Gammaproteobacteria bacterium]
MAHIKKEKIPVDSIQVGMYVCELDRPWTSTSFPLQGFYVNSVSYIEQLQAICQYVFIDIKLTLEWQTNKHLHCAPGEGEKAKFKSGFSAVDRNRLNRVRYQNQSELSDELPVAAEALDVLMKAYDDFCETVDVPNEAQSIQLKQSAMLAIDSLIRNPGAMLWQSAVTQSENRLLNHSLHCMVFAAALGRRLGLAENELKTAAFGALLMDIGKILFPKKWFEPNHTLTDDEFKKLKGHVLKSMKIASAKKLLSNTELKVIEHHHEKFDGTGYPSGIAGNSIHLHARIASIVDHYTAIITPRPSAKPISPAEAQNRIYKLKGVEVQSELIEEFIQSIGLYPAASLVELRSGEIATVLTANSKNKLRPTVIILLDENKQWLDTFELVDLSSKDIDKKAMDRSVKQALEMGAYGITSEVLNSIELEDFIKVEVKQEKPKPAPKKGFWRRRKTV